jgi:hypothetical protein
MSKIVIEIKEEKESKKQKPRKKRSRIPGVDLPPSLEEAITGRKRKQ